MADPLFPFHTLRSIVSGTSAIDVPALNVRSRAEAEGFVTAYGFRLDDPHDQAEVAALRSEAVAFLDRMLDLSDRIPDAVRDESDVLTLLRIASGLEHHMALAYGDHRAALRDTAAALGIPVLEI